MSERSRLGLEFSPIYGLSDRNRYKGDDEHSRERRTSTQKRLPSKNQNSVSPLFVPHTLTTQTDADRPECVYRLDISREELSSLMGSLGPYLVDVMFFVHFEA